MPPPGTRPAVVAIRLARRLNRALPEEGEVAGLLALMLLTEARREATTDPEGAYVPISAQDRSRWDSAMIAEGTVLINQALARRPIGPYQLWAAIAAVHGEAPSAERTDWRQILTLYALLDVIAPGPVVSLDRVVAVSMVQGAGLALRELAEAEVREPELAEEPRLEAVRAWLLALSGEEEAAREHYLRAAARAPTVAERRYLEGLARPGS
jgi:predicted RNA polymerase sigma factor